MTGLLHPDDDRTRSLPDHVRAHPTFQRWLANTRAAGNEIIAARCEWAGGRRADGRAPFLFVVYAAVWVAAEHKVKADEIVVGRPDVAVVAAHTRNPAGRGRLVLLVREFRTAATEAGGYTLTLPGGSVETGVEPRTTAARRLADDTGVPVEADRLRHHGARQALGTLLAHRAHLFSVELTAAELAAAGLEPDTVAGTQPRALLADVGQLPDGVDWATTGLIHTALAGPPGRPRR